MIDFVETPGGGTIGIIACPGAPAHDPGALRRDLETIRAWGATALVTLITARERTPRGPDEIGDVARSLGLEWHWLPIDDMYAPDHRFEERWRVSGTTLRRRLRSRERIVVHCKGGLGRSGTVAARLLVELGAEPGTAITRVRSARSGAIETTAQERHVEACVAIALETDQTRVVAIAGRPSAAEGAEQRNMVAEEHPKLVEFSRTAFRIQAPSGWIDIKVNRPSNENGAGALDRLLNDRGVREYAFITAYNPDGSLQDDSSNRDAQERLRARLDEMGWEHLPGVGEPAPPLDGSDPWAPEPSFLVLGMNRDTARLLGCEFGQAAVVCGRIGEPAELVSSSQRDIRHSDDREKS